MIVALITAGTALIVALVAGWFSYRSARGVEQLRHAHEELSRLSSATGALRLELFLSTRSVVRRLGHYHRGPEGKPRVVETRRREGNEREFHAGGLLVYRLLRPLTVSYLIEQQTFYADLLLEPRMVDLLRFNHAAFEMLTGDRLGEGFDLQGSFPGFDMDHCWESGDERSAIPFQRVRASYLRTAAAGLVVLDPGRHPDQRCMTHPEFRKHWECAEQECEIHATLAPLTAIIDTFTPQSNPIFWLRLVGYAYVCQWFHDQVRAEARHAKIAYTPVELAVPGLLASTGDAYLTRHADDYVQRFADIVRTAL